MTKEEIDIDHSHPHQNIHKHLPLHACRHTQEHFKIHINTIKFNSAHGSSFTNSYSTRHKAEQRERLWEKKCSKQSRENLILDPIMTLEESIESHVRIIYINNNEDCGVGEDVVRFCTPGAKWLNLMLLGHMQIITEN